MIIRENNTDYDERVFEVGDYIECADGRTIFSTALEIIPSEEQVMTSCGDAYYDFGISFDTIIKIADKIKELRKDKNGQ